MNTLDDFITLVRDELGLPVTAEDAGLGFDELPGWDSMYVLSLLAALERRTGRSISLPELLDASSLEDVYALAAGPGPGGRAV